MAKAFLPTWQLPLTPPASPHPLEISGPYQSVTSSPVLGCWAPSRVSFRTSPSEHPSATPGTRSRNQGPKLRKPATACPLRAVGDTKPISDSANNNPPLLALRPVRPQSAIPGPPFQLGLASESSSGPTTPNPHMLHHRDKDSQQDTTTSPVPVPPTLQQHKLAFPSPFALSQTILTTNLVSELQPMFPSLLSRQGWDRPTAQICYIWALKNPRIALLLYMTDNLCCWPIAAIFSPLADTLLPLTEVDVDGVVSNSMAVMDAQWRVVTGALPPSGAHIEMRLNEPSPVKVVGSIQPHDGNKLEVIEKVHWKGLGSRVYARKYTRHQSKAEVLGQIETFRNLQYKGIIEIRCTYAFGDLFYMLMPLADCNLESYLLLPSSDDRADQMRNWLVDLISALDHLHSYNVRHRSIRPAKILIIGNRILFGAFGIGEAHGNEVQDPFNSSSVGPAMYAAPETVARNKYFRASDVFALGCVFLEMMTVMKGQTIGAFRLSRSNLNDTSFQGNLDRVLAWIQLLETRAGFGLRDEFMSDGMALTLISWMLDEEHAKRPKARVLAASFNEWSFGRSIGSQDTRGRSSAA